MYDFFPKYENMQFYTMKSKWCLPKAFYNSREAVELLHQGSHQKSVIYTPATGMWARILLIQHSKAHRFHSLNATFLPLEINRNRNIGLFLLIQQTLIGERPCSHLISAHLKHCTLFHPYDIHWSYYHNNKNSLLLLYIQKRAILYQFDKVQIWLEDDEC